MPTLYLCNPGEHMRVAGRLVTDSTPVQLPDTPGVREHVRLRRLRRVTPSRNSARAAATTLSKDKS